jgi:endoglucanase
MTTATTPVQQHGRLRATAHRLCDEHGAEIQLRGMSSHGMQWYPGFMSAKTMAKLRDEWGASVVRLAMYLDEDGYMRDLATQQRLRGTIDAAIDVAIQAGMYVVIDWHVHPHDDYPCSGDPRKYKDFAVEFFQSVAQKYGGFPNIIYEIANEPNGVEWGQIRPYAEDVINAIRVLDAHNLIIVGTPMWSQNVDVAARDALKANNVAYALHFYAATHGEELKQRIDEARGLGQLVFVSEWGTTQAGGSGGVEEGKTRQWIQFLNERKISWINWSLCAKEEDSAALRPNSPVDGGWSDQHLTTSGLLVKELMITP